MKKESSIQWSLPDWRRAAVGTGVSVLFLLGLTAGCAGLMAYQVLDLGWANLAAALILVISALMGALWVFGGGGGVPGVAVTGGAFLLVLLAINAGAFRGDLSGGFVTVLAVAGGCGAGMLIARKPAGRKRSRRKRRTR